MCSRDEVMGGWRKPHTEELHDLYSSPSIIQNYKVEEDEVGGECRANGEMRTAYRLLVGKPERKRPLGRPIHRWVDNIKMDLVEVGCGGVDWIGLAQARNKWRALVNTVMNLRVLQNAGKLSSGCTIGGLSSSAQLHIVSSSCNLSLIESITEIHCQMELYNYNVLNKTISL
jgi:hypothetical protein